MKFLEKSFTTAIGSLPHHNIDAALAFAFQTDVPFLPQIPIRNPWEFMIAQVLEGLPGLRVEKDGAVALDVDVWVGRAHTFGQQLDRAFEESAKNPDAFAAFEPSTATSSSWQPFLWELEEKKLKFAKIQLAGPLTSQWVLRAKDGSELLKNTDVTSQIYKLVLARALAMTRRLQADGIQPLLYLDEPGLYCYSAKNPRHAMALQELKLMVQALKKEKVVVGVHCCSDTDWPLVLKSGIDILSIDTGLSLRKLLEYPQEIKAFLAEGSRLSLGVIPTSKTSGEIRDFDIKSLVRNLREVFKEKLGVQMAENVLARSIYTPACGLALLSIADAEVVLSTLLEFHKHITRASDNLT